MSHNLKTGMSIFKQLQNLGLLCLIAGVKVKTAKKLSRNMTIAFLDIEVGTISKKIDKIGYLSEKSGIEYLSNERD